MNVFYGRIKKAASVRSPKVALGTFDGVHVGHRRVLQELLRWARATDSDAVVVTFDHKPRHVLNGRPPEQITSLKHRLILFERLGLDATLVLRFNQALASCGPEDFVRDILAKQLHISGVLLGHDTRFGHRARGDLALLRGIGDRAGFEARSVPVAELDGAPVSSTRVRRAIESGDLCMAERLLGRRVSILSTVVPGTGRGRTIGYPTANLEPQHGVRPPEGVYATLTIACSDVHESVTNIGRPPALDTSVAPSALRRVVVETHLLDFSGDLYGEDVEVRFVERLRPERAFQSAEALAEAIAADIAAARTILATARKVGEPTG